MRGLGLGFSLAVLAASFGVVIGCGDTDDGGKSGNDAGSAGQSVSGAGGAASAGTSGSSSGGSSAGTTIGGASVSTSGTTSSGQAGSAAGGTSAGTAAEGGAPGAGAGSLYDCNPTKVACKIAVPDCPANQVPSVEGTCWGDCVTISQCACSEADDCPDMNTCWSKQHCGPFVR